MKIPVYSLKGEVKGSITLSKAISQPVREDIIKRAVVAEAASERQPYGTDPIAGMRSSAHYHGRRGIRHSMMNREMARMKRIHGSGFLTMTARTVPQAIKGRKAHPPKVEKVWEKKLNKKERAVAILSAISASSDRDIVESRGHRVEKVKHIPLVLEDGFQSLEKVKEVLETLEKLGLKEELERAKAKKIRSGKGVTRGRKYRKKTGPLIIVSEDKGISRAARNLPGVDVLEVGNLRVKNLAPGSQPGRLCIWTESALNKLEKGE
jgi:large subunit ribosomal protein L4e